MKSRDIEIIFQQKSSHEQSVAKEASETAEMHAAISSITHQRDERMAERDRLKNDIASTQKLIAQRLEAQREHAAKIDAQARFNTPELDFWVDYLCMRIEGAGQVSRCYAALNPVSWSLSTFSLLSHLYGGKLLMLHANSWTLQADRLKFVFTHMDERDWEKEAWFELSTEKRDYEIKGRKPKLEGDRLERCVEVLNQNRDLGMFLKGMRELFVEALKQ